MDEREKAGAGKAGYIAVFPCVMGLAVYLRLAFSIPALMAVKPNTVAVLAMIALGLTHGIGYLVANRSS